MKLLPLLPLLPLLCALSLVAAACATTKPMFPHTTHLAKNIDCASCHDNKAPGTPKLDTASCTTCHAERKLSPPKVPEVKAGVLPRAPFTHTRHKGMVPCKKCHEPIVDGSLRPGKLSSPPTTCAACHKAETAVAGQTDKMCAECHGVDVGKLTPPSHDEEWRKGHGPAIAKTRPDQHGASCETCHDRKDPCMRCHETDKPMSHADHLGARKAKCKDCHVEADRRALPRLAYEGCATTACHGRKFEAVAVKTPSRDLRAYFPHDTHVGAKDLECKECHKATVEDAQSASEPLVARPACTSCHDDRKVQLTEVQCARCHKPDPLEVQPKDHDVLWTKKHGPRSKWVANGEHGQDCATCHTRSKCVSCHATTAPGSHDGLWRTRTHGRFAAWDRESCKTCHETGTCDGCHKRTAPLNHRGAWRSLHGLAASVKSNESCMVCHQPGWCVSCHAGGK